MPPISRRKFSISAALGFGGLTYGMDLETYKRLGLHQPLMDKIGVMEDSINGNQMGDVSEYLNPTEDQQYHPCAEAYPNSVIPEGDVLHFASWKSTKVFVDTVRDFWVYLPEGLQESQEYSLMVYQDGAMYMDPNGPVRVTKVLDSLIHAKELPPTVALFVNPGVIREEDWIKQRSIEYDSVNNRYVDFLTSELLPFVESKMGFRFSKNPAERMICGISSGGICAFNAAWHNPEAFGRVLSHCGSFVNLRGAHNYPYLVRTTPRKEIKTFLQSGARDLNTVVGNWPLANKLMAEALDFSGYSSKFIFGEGGHSLRHGGAIFSESLRWLNE